MSYIIDHVKMRDSREIKSIILPGKLMVHDDKVVSISLQNQ